MITTTHWVGTHTILRIYVSLPQLNVYMWSIILTSWVRYFKRIFFLTSQINNKLLNNLIYNARCCGDKFCWTSMFGQPSILPNSIRRKYRKNLSNQNPLLSKEGVDFNKCRSAFTGYVSLYKIEIEGRESFREFLGQYWLWCLVFLWLRNVYKTVIYF